MLRTLYGSFGKKEICCVSELIPEKTPFNLDKNTSEDIRATMVLAGLWMIVFSIPLFLFVKEGAPATNISNPFN